MCLAIPMQLIARDGDRGMGETDGVRTPIRLTLCPEARIGDWLIVHAGYALAILTQSEAEETRELLDQLGETQ